MAEKAYGVGIDTSELEKDGKKIQQVFDNSGNAAKAASATFDNASKSASDAVKENLKVTKDAYNEQKKKIKEIADEIKKLEDLRKSAAKGTDMSSLDNPINELKESLKSAQSEFDKMVVSSDKTTASTANLRTQLKKNTQELAQMRVNGQELSEEYMQLQSETAKLADSMQEASAGVKVLSSPAVGLQALTQAAGLVSCTQIVTKYKPDCE